MRNARWVLPLLLSALAFATPASADTITTFGGINVNTMTATDNGNGTTTLSTSSNVNITQLIIGALDPNALFQFTATSNADAFEPVPGVTTQRFAGSFTLTNQAQTFTYLEGTFGAALEFGGTGSTGATFLSNSFPQNPPLTLATDLPIDLTNPESFQLSLANIFPTLHTNTYLVNGVPHTTIASFTASYSGVADAALQVSEVPEPATMMLLGTGLVGIVARRRATRK